VADTSAPNRFRSSVNWHLTTGGKVAYPYNPLPLPPAPGQVKPAPAAGRLTACKGNAIGAGHYVLPLAR